MLVARVLYELPLNFHVLQLLAALAAMRSYVGRKGAVREVFGDSIDYASEIKVFTDNPISKYVFRKMNRRTVKAIQRKARIGNPDLSMSTTCHVERTNLSLRQFNRRYGRMTLGFSKTLENLRHSTALFVWYFNFVRTHSAHGKTPAQAAGLTNEPMEIKDLLASTN